jgi:hypothetical protein
LIIIRGVINNPFTKIPQICMPHVYTKIIPLLGRFKLPKLYSTDRERGGHEERERGGHEETERDILPVRSVDQRLVESIRVTTTQPIRISLGFCEHL